MNQVIDFFKKLFDGADWPPRWHCGKWSEFHGWLYIVSDLLIWSAYFAIPVVIIRYISSKNDIRFTKLYFLFAAFILACGATHFLDALAFWIPVYRLNALVRFITGVISWATVFFLVKYLPVIFSLRSQSALENEIEDRKKAEAALQKIKKDYEILVNGVKDYAIFRLDQDGHVASWNNGAENIKGYTAAEIIGKPLDVFYTREEILRGEPDRNLKMAIEHGHFETEGWRVRKDNSTFWANITLTTLFDEEQQFYGFVKITKDITDKKKAEDDLNNLNTALEQKVKERTEAFLKSEGKFKRIFDSKMAGIMYWDENGEISDANERFLEIVGYTRQDLEDGKLHWNKMTPAQFAELDQWGLKQIEMTGVCPPVKKEYYRKDGSRVPILIGAALLNHDSIYKGVAYITDITELKKAEQQITELNTGLEQKVIERTFQLEDVNKELEAFTYSVSHDLRAPLRAVNGYARMLEEDYESLFDAEGKRLLGEVQGNAKKMGMLIDDLLAFSRLGRKEVNKSRIDMNELTDAAIREVEQSHGGAINTLFSSLHPVMADYSLLLQVMINLISNAVKYSSKKDNPIIEIGSKLANGEIIFSISDNGAGFDMEYADKLFGVFQRLHSAEEFPGTGVGLAIVQRIIHKHSGKVWAEGKVDKGATFFFSLPMQKQPV